MGMSVCNGLNTVAPYNPGEATERGAWCPAALNPRIRTERLDRVGPGAFFSFICGTVRPFSMSRVTSLVTFLVLLFAHAMASAASTPERATWAHQVQDVWQPKTFAALQQFDLLTRAQFGPALATAVADANTHPPQLLLREQMDFAQLHEAAIDAPVQAAALALLARLSDGHAEQVPPWLATGVASLMADQVLDQMALAINSRDWRQGVALALRHASALPTPAAMLTATSVSAHGTDAAVSAAMVAQLQARLGTRFYPALQQYLAGLGAGGSDREALFAAAFGVATADHARACAQALASLRAEVRQHGAPPPGAAPSTAAPLGSTTSAPAAEALASNVSAAGSGVADVSAAQSPARAASTDATPRARVAANLAAHLLPLESASAKAAFAEYQRARSPKAFAVSMRGQWAWVQDDSAAMANALRQCRWRDPVNCRLYAVDAQLQAPTGGVEIAVQMSGHGDGAWAAEVRKTWMPVVLGASAQFNKLLGKQMGVALDQDVRIYLAAGNADYARTLQEEMNMAPSAAATHADVGGGLANSRGQIALLFSPDRSRGALQERALKTSLHELTHALQNDLSHSYAGFSAPKWLREGSADLIAYTLASDAPMIGGSDVNLADWRKKCAQWYAKSGAQLSPEEVFNAKSPQWLEMMKDKRGPYQMAGLMVMYLKERTGERFFTAWADYFERAGRRGQDEASAFQDSFGIEPARFLADFKQVLATPRIAPAR
jgi:hypothetical protein